MSARLFVLLVVVALFALLTVIALADVGYLGIIAPHFESWGAGQVFADLVILCTLTIFWMISDGRARGINPWPFVALTLVAGSFGALGYLISREVGGAGRAGAASP